MASLSNISYGPELPLVANGPHGYQGLSSLGRLAKQNFKNLLLTVPGERTMKHDFGVGLRVFLFESNTIETQARIKTKILQQVNKYLPFMEIINIEMNDPGSFGSTPTELLALYINIKYFIKPLDKIDEISINIDDRVKAEALQGIDLDNEFGFARKPSYAGINY